MSQDASPDEDSGNNTDVASLLQPRIQKEPSETVVRIMSRHSVGNSEALEQRLHEEFHSFAQAVPDTNELMLTFEGLALFTDWLAEELHVDHSIFGEMNQLFWRFNFACDGRLNEAEATKLMLCMIRSYRDATQPPAPGIGAWQLGIKYKNLTDEFTVDEKLGQGGQGTVFLCTSSSRFGTPQTVVKIFDKSNPAAPIEDVTREFELLTEVRHPLIARVFDIFQDAANIYVVQEPYFGGDLSTAVQRATKMNVRVDERWLARVVQQVLTGLAFLHGSSIMHCDIKEPNVMLAAKADWQAPQIVLIDFGLANKFASRSRPGGTPGYMPPEVWESGLWTPRGDVFSVGVLLFSMRTGIPPFTMRCRSLEDIEDQTKYCVPQMEKGSSELKSLVDCMLDKHFRSRASVDTALKHHWFSLAADANQTFDDSVVASLQKQQEKTGLKKALMADLASRENLAQMKELNQLFIQLDYNGDGFVSANDVRKALEGQWPKTRIEELIQVLLGSCDGEVSYEEFMGQLIAAQEPEENELLWRIFSEVDTSRKGYLDQDDIKALLERPAVAKVLGARQPKVLMKQMSRKGTDQISFDDFKLALQGHNKSPITGLLRRGFNFGPKTRQWLDGEAAEYFSFKSNSWLPCVVTALEPSSGAVLVDIKPHYWLQGLELYTRLRRPHTKCWLGWLNWGCAGARNECAGPRGFQSR